MRAEHECYEGTGKRDENNRRWEDNTEDGGGVEERYITSGKLENPYGNII